MTSQKSFSGDVSVMHVIAMNQTLSELASNYRVPNWEGILRYNTRVFKLLDPKTNPNKLVVGQRLMIPKSPAGYKKALLTLKKLQAEIDGFEMTEYAKFDQLLAEQKAYDVLWDLAGDIATALASLTIKGLEAGKAAMATREAACEGGAMANNLQFSWAAVQGYVDETESLFDSLHVGIKAASSKFRLAGAEKIFDKFAGKELAFVRKIMKANTSLVGLEKKTTTEAAMAIAGSAADKVKAVLEFGEYFKVSTIRNVMMKETLDQVVDGQRSSIKASVERQRQRLTARITELESECNVVWDGR